MSARLCPACIHRRGRVVDPHCLVCQGEGVLMLGRAAAMSGPVETSYAVAIVLEAAARDLETRTATDPVERHRLAPAAIGQVLDGLRAAGVLAWDGVTDQADTPAGTATEMAQAVSGVVIRPMDWTLIDAQSYAYGYGDRPLARGLPVLSADGHPSHLARLCDPADPLTPTDQDVHARTSARRAGAILAAATQQRGHRRGR